MVTRLSCVRHFALTWLAVWVLGLVLPVKAAGGAATRGVLADLSPNASGAIYTEHLLWARNTRSVIECHVQCTSHANCAAFTFAPDPDGRAGLCRAHDEHAGEENNKVVTPRSMTYLLPSRANGTGLQTIQNVSSAESVTYPCSTNANCPGTNWMCINGECLCKLGAFYSISSAGCVSACNQADLQTQFVAYSGYRFEGALLGLLAWSPDFTLTGRSQTQCTQECLSRSGCFSVNHYNASLRCEGMYMNNLLQSTTLYQQTAVAYMQRKCK